MSSNAFASIHNGQLKLKRRDALEVPARVKELRRLIDSSLPRVRIEDLLRDVDRWCGFTREFHPLGGYEPRSGNVHATLLAALIAHGTNLGIAAMGQSAPGITVDMLQHLTRWLLRDETLKAANATLVNYHHQLPLSAVWGQGLISSSDGQRFGIQQSSLLASFYPRYFGYYDRAVSVYTHTLRTSTRFLARVSFRARHAKRFMSWMACSKTTRSCACGSTTPTLTGSPKISSVPHSCLATRSCRDSAICQISSSTNSIGKPITDASTPCGAGRSTWT